MKIKSFRITAAKYSPTSKVCDVASRCPSAPEHLETPSIMRSLSACGVLRAALMCRTYMYTVSIETGSVTRLLLGRATRSSPCKQKAFRIRKAEYSAWRSGARFSTNQNPRRRAVVYSFDELAPTRAVSDQTILTRFAARCCLVRCTSTDTRDLPAFLR